MAAREIIVKGKVQGVFYRAWAKENADVLGLLGWVMNMPDGSVGIRMEGDEKAIQKMIDLCRQGPTRARVDFLEIKDADSADFRDFRILR